MRLRVARRDTDSDKTKVDIVRMGATTVGCFAFEPGGGGRSASSRSPAPRAARPATSAWSIRPHDGGHDDGTELEISPGEAYIIEPGHDAWVVGDERFVAFEFESRSAEEYAKS